MSSIGHNSAAYGEKISEPFVLDDDHKKLFHYVQWQLSDYITGTQGMTVDQEGVYMRFLVRLYDRGKPFPDDDRMMARVMAMDLRPWRRIKTQLIEMGKILVKSESLTNTRFERERQKRAAELRKQAENTRKYWEEKRAKKTTSDELPANFGQTSGELCSEVLGKCSKKVNEINGDGKHPTSQSRVYSLESKERKKESPNGLLSSGECQSDEKMTASKAARIAFDLYNETAEACGIPKARILNKSRARALALRVKEVGGIEGFKQALANLAKSSFCCGQNDDGWVATIDYVCQPKGFAKLYDGGWGNGAHPVTREKPNGATKGNYSLSGNYIGDLL